jgi:hypothetical protein
MLAIPMTFVLQCLLGSILALANATAVGELLETRGRARSLWTLENGLLPRAVAISSNTSRIVHLGAIRS